MHQFYKPCSFLCIVDPSLSFVTPSYDFPMFSPSLVSLGFEASLKHSCRMVLLPRVLGAPLIHDRWFPLGLSSWGCELGFSRALLVGIHAISWKGCL